MPLNWGNTSILSGECAEDTAAQLWPRGEGEGSSGSGGVFSEIASQAEAEAGTDNTKGMTPLRTAQAIAELASSSGVSSVGATAPITSSGGATPTIAISPADGSGAGSMSSAHYTKLEGISSGATANDTDANLKNRANHTGTQAISTVTGLQTALDGKAATSHSHTLSNITDAGTAAALNVPAAGDASSGEVVKGDDSRLSDSRTPTSHNHDDRYYTETETNDLLDDKLDAAPSAFSSLTDGATITWNTQGKPTVNAIVTLGGNRTLSISNAASGTSGILIVKQDGSGNRTLTLPAGSIVVDGGGGVIALSPGVNAIDVLSFIYDGTNYLWSYGKTFS